MMKANVHNTSNNFFSSSLLPANVRFFLFDDFCTESNTAT